MSSDRSAASEREEAMMPASATPLSEPIAPIQPAIRSATITNHAVFRNDAIIDPSISCL
jgi:hypothetical protein